MRWWWPSGFLEVFRDAGLSSAAIQREELTEEHASTLFWINSVMGLALAVLTIALAPLIATFYDDDRLFMVAVVASLSFVFGGLAVQHQARLVRAMRFREKAFIDVSSMVVGIVATISMAWMGFEYMALAWMPVVTACSHLLLTWLTVRWRPRFMLRLSGLGELLRFGMDVTAFSTINYFARNLDNVLIGKVWGAIELGLYSRAYSLLTLPIRQINAPITAVAFPTLSRLQSDPPRFRRYYLNALLLLTSLTTPLSLVLAVLAPEVVTIVLGPQWIEAVPIFQLLALSAVVQPVLNTSGWLYTATGNTRGLLKWGSLGALWLIMSFFAGLPFGATGVAAAYAIAIAFWAYPCMKLAAENTLISSTDIWRVVWDPFLASVPGILVLMLLRILVGDQMPPWIWVGVGLVIMGATYWWILAHVLGRRGLILDVARQLRRRTTPSDSTSKEVLV